MEEIFKRAKLRFEQLNEIYLLVSDEDFFELSSCLFNELQARLKVMFARDCREKERVFKIYACFSLVKEDRFVILYQEIDAENPRFTSITPKVPAAHWYEREIRDLFGIEPVGHPDSRRLILNEFFPENSYPLRKDWKIGDEELSQWGRGEKVVVPYNFMKVEGEGVYEIPVGPVHAGIIEPGHFRFSAVGETIFFLEARLFYTHKGTEKHFEKLGFFEGVRLAERISGTSSIAHSLAYILAVERMSDINIPERASAIRTVLLELERLYNHIGDVGNMCAGTGFVVGNAMGAYIKEMLMQLNEKISGSRYLRGVNIISGVNIDIFSKKELILETLLKVENDFRKYVECLLNSVSHVERLENTGKLSKDIVRLLGGTGIAAKASGIDDDIRKIHPHLLYKDINFKTISLEKGDVLERMMVRVEEAYESIKIIREILLRNYSSELAIKDIAIKPNSQAFGYTESPRGSVFYFVASDDKGNVERVKIRSSSYCNWPLMPYAVHGNIVPDFPLCNKSFNLSYSGTDM